MSSRSSAPSSRTTVPELSRMTIRMLAAGSRKYQTMEAPGRGFSPQNWRSPG